MRGHGGHYLRYCIKFDHFIVLGFATELGFFFVGTLWGVILGILLKYFTTFRGVSRAMYQAYFLTSWTIAWMACIMFLVIVRASLLGVGR